MFNSVFKGLGITAFALSLSTSAIAQGLIIYPSKGQSLNQQQKDQGECQVWATQSTGIDPAIQAQTTVSSGGGERLAGATRGAFGGMAIGAIAGDAGKGAAIGAIIGTMAGGRQARQNQSAKQQQAQAQREQQINTWNRAVSACLEARGYTVK